MKRIGAIGLVLIALSTPIFADDFDAVAKGIETHYSIHRVSPLLIGFESLIAKPALWGSGAGGLRIATFENENRALEPSVIELEQVMLAALAPIWQPFVRVDSRKDGEAVVIYSIVKDKHVTLLIGSVERNDISLVQISLSPKAFEDWKADPKEKAQSAAHAH